MALERIVAQNTKDSIVEALLLRDQLADIIRRMIMLGKFRPGEQISERQLSQKFEISTTPIKEALRILQAEGLVYTKPRVGTFVAEISSGRIYQIVAMRGALEGVAAGFAAHYRTDAEIAEMTALLDRVEEYLEKGFEDQQIAQLNEKFHRTLRGACRNDYLINLVCNMNSIDRTIRSLSFEVCEPQREAQEAYREHRQILQAVVAQDADAAEALMGRHIRRVADRVLNDK